jgi:UDP:flavonoid glycosyltransferase YjiC (YdhE family)
MHITILALGSRGDVQPYAVLGKGLRAAGHQIRFITFESFEPLVKENGLDFHPIRGDAQSLVAEAGANMLALLRKFNGLAASYTNDLPVAQLKDTDVIINQLPLALYGYDLAEKFNVPLIMAAVMPLTPTRAFPMMGFPQLRLPGYNRFSYRAATNLIWLLYRPIINRWRTETLQLPLLKRHGYFDQLGTARIPVINGFSPIVVPRPIDWNANIHLTGYWFPEDEAWQPPDDLRAFIESGSPPIFIGFGSMPVRDPQRTTQIILDAVQRTNQRAILHAGWGNLGQQDLPSNIFKIDNAPYSWLFPRMSLIIHHGGSGTTGFALRSGVPSMVVPFLFDQFFWGRRSNELGVGPPPIAFRHLSVDRLVQAIALSINNQSMQQRAQEIGTKIQQENGIEAAIKIIEQRVQH